MSNLVPDGWDVKELRDLVAFSNGKGHEKHISEAGKYVVVNSKYISSDGTVFKHSNESFCPASTDDILMVMSDVPNGKAIAKCFLVDVDNKYTVNQRIARFRSKGSDPLFLFYSINRNSYYLEFDDGLKQTNLRKDDVLDCPIKAPPLPEQQKIAKILTSVDEVIEKTQAQIDKLKDLKTGMMQELLTNGIGHTEFKDSPVGRIPAEWERVSLGSVSSLITKGATPTTYGHAYVNSGVRFFRSVNASEDGTLQVNDIRYISEEANRSIRRSGLKLGDIVISIVGAKTGRTYFCIESAVHLPANINQNIALIRPDNEVLASEFLKFVISSMDFQHQVDLEITTQAQPSLSLKQVGEFELNLPPIKEQFLIAQKLNSVVSYIESSQDKLQQTKLLKKALMQDLLTGKVRVNTELTNTEVAVG
jgi:type I restriction enzyme S subunit